MDAQTYSTDKESTLISFQMYSKTVESCPNDLTVGIVSAPYIFLQNNLLIWPLAICLYTFFHDVSLNPYCMLRLFSPLYLKLACDHTLPYIFPNVRLRTVKADPHYLNVFFIVNIRRYIIRWSLQWCSSIEKNTCICFLVIAISSYTQIHKIDRYASTSLHFCR